MGSDLLDASGDRREQHRKSSTEERNLRAPSSLFQAQGLCYLFFSKLEIDGFYGVFRVDIY